MLDFHACFPLHENNLSLVPWKKCHASSGRNYKISTLGQTLFFNGGQTNDDGKLSIVRILGTLPFPILLCGDMFPFQVLQKLGWIMEILSRPILEEKSWSVWKKTQFFTNFPGSKIDNVNIEQTEQKFIAFFRPEILLFASLVYSTNAIYPTRHSGLKHFLF